MNIGIILYSNTGNTLSVGEKIKEALLAKGHTVRLERISAENEASPVKGPIRLTAIPDPSPYDAVIFGGPVVGAQLSPFMKEYLTRLPALQGKKVACFVTQHFKLKWMGSTRAVKQITRAVEQKGAPLVASGIVQWSSELRDEQISQVAESLSRI
jgi:menaquinone-dependent protoporphyrinogen IX oxidase